MKTLAISTASAALSLTLFDDDHVVAHDHRIIGRGHAEALVPAISALMAGRIADAIIVDVGPGSFTGIRIGIAAARALGLAWAAPVSGCESGALVAAHGFALSPGLTAITVLLDAGRGQILQQRFTADLASSTIIMTTADALEIPDGEAIAGGAVPRNRSGVVHMAEPDTAFALHLPPVRRSLAPAALYVRPPDAVLPL